MCVYSFSPFTPLMYSTISKTVLTAKFYRKGKEWIIDETGTFHEAFTGLVRTIHAIWSLLIWDPRKKNIENYHK